MSPWIQHVKNFAKAKGMKYNEALKSSECKNSYKKQKYFFCYYIIYNYSIIMSISSTGLYGSATIVNTDLFDDIEALKEEVTTLSTSYLTTTNEHRIDISQNRRDISSNLSKINDIVKQNKKGKKCAVFCFAGKRKIFFIYLRSDYMGKKKKKLC